MSFSCTSPTSTSEEDWIHEVLSFSPLDLNTSNDVQSSLSSPVYGPETGREIAPDYEDLFSTGSSGNTSVTTPGTGSHAQEKNEHLLDSVSVKLRQLKTQNSLTPKALESVFNTQDVLADSCDWQGGAKHKHRKAKCGALAGAGADSHRQKTAAMHSHKQRKRKNSRGKTPKPAHSQLTPLSSVPHSALSSPHPTRKGSMANLQACTTSMSEPNILSTSLPSSTYDTPCFPESWFSSSNVPGSGPAASGPASPSSLFTHVPNMENSAYREPYSDTQNIRNTDLSVSPIAEEPASLFASAGPVQTSENCMEDRYDNAFQEAVAYIDYLQAENMLQASQQAI